MSAAVEAELAPPPTHEWAGREDAPVILALGGISADHHVVSHAANPAPGWWQGMAGPGRVLDLGVRRVLGVRYRDGGRAADGRPAVAVTTHDQAAHIIALADQLRIERFGAVIGASYGGMVALAMAEQWPDRMERLVVISAAHRTHPMATALRVAQRRVVELGLASGHAVEAMVIARGIAMTTYRTAGEFAERFDAVPAWTAERDARFDVERYLRRAGERFAERIAPERFLALSLSADLHAVTPERIAVPTTVVAAQGDTLVLPAQSRELARRLPHLDRFVTLRTRFGHDAFLTEPARLGRVLATALAQ